MPALAWPPPSTGTIAATAIIVSRFKAVPPLAEKTTLVGSGSRAGSITTARQIARPEQSRKMLT